MIKSYICDKCQMEVKEVISWIYFQPIGNSWETQMDERSRVYDFCKECFEYGMSFLERKKAKINLSLTINNMSKHKKTSHKKKKK